jgi:hypothetical protein
MNSSMLYIQLNTISSLPHLYLMQILHQRQQWHLELNPIQIHQVDVDDDDVVDDQVDDDDDDIPDLVVVYNLKFWADNKVINGG